MVKPWYEENVKTSTPPYFLLMKDKLGVYLITVYTPLRISKKVTVTQLADCLDEWGYADSVTWNTDRWFIKQKY